MAPTHLSPSMACNQEQASHYGTHTFITIHGLQPRTCVTLRLWHPHIYHHPWPATKNMRHTMAPTHLSPSMACNREHASHYGTHTIITVHGLQSRTCVTLWHPHIYHHPWPAMENMRHTMAPTHLSPSMACIQEHASHYGTHTFITIHGLQWRTCVILWHPHIYHHPWPATKNMRHTMAPTHLSPSMACNQEHASHYGTHTFITIHGLQSRTCVTLWHPHIYHRPWPATENMRHTMAPTHLSPSMACNQEHASHYGTHTLYHGLQPRTCVTLWHPHIYHHPWPAIKNMRHTMAPTHLSPSMACNREHASHYGTHTFITVHGLQSRTCVTLWHPHIYHRPWPAIKNMRHTMAPTHLSPSMACNQEHASHYGTHTYHHPWPATKNMRYTMAPTHLSPSMACIHEHALHYGTHTFITVHGLQSRTCVTLWHPHIYHRPWPAIEYASHYGTHTFITIHGLQPRTCVTLWHPHIYHHPWPATENMRHTMAPTHLSPSMACNQEHASHHGTHTFITVHRLQSRTCVTLWHPHIYHHPWPASKNMRHTMAPTHLSPSMACIQEHASHYGTHTFITVHGLQSEHASHYGTHTFITVHGLHPRTCVTLWHPHIYHHPWPASMNMRYTMAPTHLSPSMACNREHASHYGTHTFITVHGLQSRTCVTLWHPHIYHRPWPAIENMHHISADTG